MRAQVVPNYNGSRFGFDNAGRRVHVHHFAPLTFACVTHLRRSGHRVTTDAFVLDGRDPPPVLLVDLGTGLSLFDCGGDLLRFVTEASLPPPLARHPFPLTCFHRSLLPRGVPPLETVSAWGKPNAATLQLTLRNGALVQLTAARVDLAVPRPDTPAGEPVRYVWQRAFNLGGTYERTDDTP